MARLRDILLRFRGLLTPSPQNILNQIRKSCSSELPPTRSPSFDSSMWDSNTWPQGHSQTGASTGWRNHGQVNWVKVLQHHISRTDDQPTAVSLGAQVDKRVIIPRAGLSVRLKRQIIWSLELSWWLLQKLRRQRKKQIKFSVEKGLFGRTVVEYVSFFVNPVTCMHLYIFTYVYILII